MRRILRRVLRKILKILTKATLKKHKPQIIALVGESRTALLREALYTAIHKQVPTRRNIESPEAEFVVPLTIIGAKHYPQNCFKWITLIGKTIAQLILLKPHQNVLVLEYNTSLSEILKYWLEITNPKIIIECGKRPQTRYQGEEKKYKLTEDESINLEKISKIVKKIASDLELTTNKLEQNLKDLPLPQPRIKILPGKKGYLVIDATYIYFPPLEQSLNEILSSLSGRKIWIRSKNDWEKAKLGPQDIVIIIGPRKNSLPVVEDARQDPLEI
ncbi:MAG: hypothetical protein U9M98_03105 [Patescibacteria group bacterium]|nr:hypothetical protein [Patescibacteria group bacterium]